LSAQAPVGIDDLAVDPPARAGEEGHNLGDVAGLPQAAHGGCTGEGVDYQRRWRDLAWSAVAGTASLCCWLSLLLVTAPDPTNQNDHTAGIATIILSVPLFVVVSALLASGAGIGVLYRRGRRRCPKARGGKPDRAQLPA
jgi:hypothetical protein